MRALTATGRISRRKDETISTIRQFLFECRLHRLTGSVLLCVDSTDEQHMQA